MTSERPCLNWHDDYRCMLGTAVTPADHAADDGEQVVATWTEVPS